MNQTNQQGDVILEEIQGDFPDGLEFHPCKERIVRTGESHHEHVLIAEREEDMEIAEREGVLYLRINHPVSLVHRVRGGTGAGEHKIQTIEPKRYFDRGVVEWNPWEQEARRVQD